MYPIDVQQLIRRGTLGSRALDPTLPYRPPRFRWLHRTNVTEELVRESPRRAARPAWSGVGARHLV